jgi:DNA polymerase-3 subunit epsilon
MEKAFERTSKIIAAGSPFESKEILKQRGYRWGDGSQGGIKAWWTVVPEEDEKQELAFLANEVYPNGNTKQVVIKHIDALARFSVREL